MELWDVYDRQGNLTGKVKARGDVFEEGCIREAAEEIGLHLYPEEITLLFRNFEEDNMFDDYATVRDFDIKDAVLQADELAEIKWMTLEEIKALCEKGEFIYSYIDELDKVAAYIKGGHQ